MMSVYISDKNKKLYDIYELLQDDSDVQKISLNFTCCVCKNKLPLSTGMIHNIQCNIESTEKIIYNLRKYSKNHKSLNYVDLLSFIGLKDNKMDNTVLCILNKYYQLYSICNHHSILHEILNILTLYNVNLPVDINPDYSHMLNTYHKKILSQLKKNIDKNVNDILFHIALKEIYTY